jgi:CRP/FNR family transcriptional regulator, cyclic AMP receptor protein
MTTTISIFKHEKNTEFYSAGETVFNAGDEGHHMYVVQEGEVEVNANGKIIDTLGPGSTFGEMAIIDQSPRTATVVAKTDCRLVALDEEKFLYHVHRTPFFALTVLRVVTERLRRRMMDSVN